MITQKRLKEVLNYDPDTGIFTRTVRAANRAKVVGSKHSDGYLVATIDYRQSLLHRLAWLYMTGEWPDEVDHINHIRDDNRWINLREAGRQENSRNQSMSSRNTSGVTGVSWHKREKIWQAYIQGNEKQKGLGLFKEKWDAICARKSAEHLLGYHKNHGK